MPSEREAFSRRPDEDPASSPAAALKSFLDAILARRLVFAAIVAVCLLAAGAWLAHRTITYEADAEILVTPIPASNSSFVGLPLIRASELEPQRAAVTAAGVLDTPAANRLAAARLGLEQAAVESAVEVAAVSNSSLVEVKAEADSATESTRIADGFATAALAVRARYLAPRVEEAIARTEEQLELLPDAKGAEANVLKAQLTELRSISQRGDPTLALARSASRGVTQDSSSKEVLLTALLAGLLLAGLTIVLIQILTAHPVGTESELAKLYPLPVLARVPTAGGRGSTDFRGSLDGDPASVREGFRALRGQLELRAPGGNGTRGQRGTTVMMISPEPDASRPACSLDLARAFASIHESAAVLELDFENPHIATMVDLDPRADLAAVLNGADLESAAESIGDTGVRLLAAPAAIDSSTHEALWARSAAIVEDARRLDDWVVIDAAPVTESVADTAAVLHAIDHVVVVVNVGSTRPEALGVLRELFDLLQKRPDGYLVVGGSTT